MIENSAFKNIKCLIVDDDPSTQHLLRGYVGYLGCEAHYANNGEEAIDLLKAKTYDICFMDIKMPVMDGLVATRIIRTDITDEMPIIAISEVVKEENKQVCFDSGMNDFMSKPIYLWDMEDMIKKYVIRVREQQANN